MLLFQRITSSATFSSVRVTCPSVSSYICPLQNALGTSESIREFNDWKVIFVFITRIKFVPISIDNFKQVIVKTFLFRIHIHIVIGTQFEFKIPFMICCDLDSDFCLLSGFESVHNNSISISSRNLMWFRAIPWITANATFASKILLVLKTNEICQFIFHHIKTNSKIQILLLLHKTLGCHCNLEGLGNHLSTC